MKKEIDNISGIIYLVENKENNKKYVGATTQSIEVRKKDHIQKALKGSGHEFHKAIQTYGSESFHWIAIDTAWSAEELAQKEKYYIDFYDSFRNGCNSDRGGGFKKPVYRYDDTGRLQRRYESLQQASNELGISKQVLSKICLGVHQRFDNSHWTYDLQDVFKPKKDLRMNQVNQLNPKGAIKCSFPSIVEASKKTGINKSSIAKCCRGEREMAGGFKFKYNNMSKELTTNGRESNQLQYKERERIELDTNKSINNNIIYVTDSNVPVFDKDSSTNTGVHSGFSGSSTDEIYARFAPFMDKPNMINVPKKVEYNLKKYVSKKLMKKVHPDLEVAKEICLIVISNLSSTYYLKNKWISLHSSILKDQTKYKADNTWNYKNGIEVLKHGTKKNGPFIEVKDSENSKETYVVGEFSKKYKISDVYLKAGIINYELKSDWLINNRLGYLKEKAVKYSKNVICNNLVQFYLSLELPSSADLLKKGRELASKKTRTKKGKIITMLNKHSNSRRKKGINSHWVDPKNRSFVEDNIKRFESLTRNGPRIFSIGSSKSGHRVYDSISLMPSWIRKECKIQGVPIAIVDYSCLHPNIANKEYGGSGDQITHLKVANYLGIDELKAKKQHLSFFNMKPHIMKGMKCFKYYNKEEPEMMKRIFSDKKLIANEKKCAKDKKKKGDNIISSKLLTKEVRIVTDVISVLNGRGIYVGYVYDGLCCHPDQIETVLKVMNEIIQAHGVNTRASIE